MVLVGSAKSSDIPLMNTHLHPVYKKWLTNKSDGRYGNNLGKVIGPHKLPILSVSSRLSRVMLREAHAQIHKGVADT